MKNGRYYPLSLIYQTVSRIIRRLYYFGLLPSHKAPLPVVSVGNIVFGGSGKTPLVQNLLDYLSGQGFTPALITRGYQGRWEKNGGCIPSNSKKDIDWRDTGDEPCMIARNRPHTGIFIGKDKLKSCRKAWETGHDIAVVDDGFQHYRLHRDIDIVLHSLGRRSLKREPLSSLKMADIILLEDKGPSGEKDLLRRKTGDVPVYSYSAEPAGFFQAETGKPVTQTKLKKTPVLAFCGIANPQRFLDLLNQSGIYPRDFLVFPDHHPYPLTSIDKIIRRFHACGAHAGITTEKDLVKLKSLQTVPEFSLWTAKIRLKIDSGFYQTLKQQLDKLTAAEKK